MPLQCMHSMWLLQFSACFDFIRTYLMVQGSQVLAGFNAAAAHEPGSVALGAGSSGALFSDMQAQEVG
jgi:hypothetical protein